MHFCYFEIKIFHNQISNYGAKIFFSKDLHLSQSHKWKRGRSLFKTIHIKITIQYNLLTNAPNSI